MAAYRGHRGLLPEFSREAEQERARARLYEGERKSPPASRDPQYTDPSDGDDTDDTDDDEVDDDDDSTDDGTEDDDADDDSEPTTGAKQRKKRKKRGDTGEIITRTADGVVFYQRDGFVSLDPPNSPRREWERCRK
jgi:hypothetical protein